MGYGTFPVSMYSFMHNLRTACTVRIERCVDVSVRSSRYPALRQSGKHRREQRAHPVRAPSLRRDIDRAGRRQRQRPVGPLPCPYRVHRTVTCGRVDESVRSYRYGGPTTGRSTREPAQRRKSADELKWAEPGSAPCGEERTGPAVRAGRSARISPDAEGASGWASRMSIPAPPNVYVRTCGRMASREPWTGPWRDRSRATSPQGVPHCEPPGVYQRGPERR